MTQNQKSWWERWREKRKLAKEERAKDQAAWVYFGVVNGTKSFLAYTSRITATVYYNDRLKEAHALYNGIKYQLDYNAIKEGKVVRI